MDEGRWVTINGTHVFVKDGQNPMDAFIRQKCGKSDYEVYNEKKKDFEQLFEKDPTTARTEFYKKMGMDGKPKVLDKEEFNKIRDDKNPIMQRSTSDKGYEDLINGDYRVSDAVNSMYGTGIYFAYGEDDKKYYAGLSNTQKVFEARVDKSAKMIDSKELDKIKENMREKLGNDRERIDNIIFADYGVFASMLGYDGVYYDNVKYGLVMNRGKLIIKK